MYRKERKKRKGSISANAIEAKIPFRPSSDDGSSCSSTIPSNAPPEEIPEIIQPGKFDFFPQKLQKSSYNNIKFQPQKRIL